MKHEKLLNFDIIMNRKPKKKKSRRNELLILHESLNRMFDNLSPLRAPQYDLTPAQRAKRRKK